MQSVSTPMNFRTDFEVHEKEELPGKGLIVQKEWLLLFEGSEPFSQVQLCNGPSSLSSEKQTAD